MLLILALRRQRPEGEIEASLVYIGNSRPAGATGLAVNNNNNNGYVETGLNCAISTPQLWGQGAWRTRIN